MAELRVLGRWGDVTGVEEEPGVDASTSWKLNKRSADTATCLHSQGAHSRSRVPVLEECSVLL